MNESTPTKGLPESHPNNPPVAADLEIAPMDPAFAGFLAQAAAQGNPPLETLPPPVGRQIYRDMAGALSLPAPPVARMVCGALKVSTSSRSTSST